MPQLCSLKTRYNCTAKPVLSSWLNILSSIRLVPRNKLIDIWTVLLEYIHNCLSMLIVLLKYIDFHTQGECSIRVYRSNICLLCQHNEATYYAQNYAGIIGASLVGSDVAMTMTVLLE